MSVISAILTKGLSALSTAKGESVGYRVGTSGGFTALPGFVLTAQRVPAPEYNQEEQAEKQKHTASLKGPVAPLLVRGYQVEDTVTGFVWSVRSVKIDVQQVCVLERVEAITFTPDRAGA